MNIRFYAVDEHGAEITSDDDAHHPPVTHVRADAVPREGEHVVFYNTRRKDEHWSVAGVVWMAAPDGGGYMHAAVALKRTGARR